ncbi:MAG TPA: dihydrolipoyl dehydrogenase [Aggregatilineales bacterium]|nr:dihydrolipoyl dehydrogenase [Anaerolineales bacterium]HRE47251.1 dihydrolipoyl dehydrogenase [Aggregatilineales bacterium]
MAQNYDVVVLGAGPGGYVAAIRAAQLGLKTAIIEKQWWGGICLNVGCIPSKALLHNAELAHIVKHRAAEFGFTISGEVQFDYSVAHKRSRSTSDRLVKGVKSLMKKNKIDTYEGWGSFTSATTLEVDLGGGKRETLNAKNVILATGSEVRMLPNTKVTERVKTYLEVILSETLPKSIIIAGAGAIGMEFAYVMHNYGVQVTVVEFMPNVLPLEDEEVSKEMERQYKKMGVSLLTGTRVDKIDEDKDGVTVTVTRDGKVETLRAEWVLQALGWRPRTEGYGLEKTGVKLTERGWIDVDDHLRTNVPGVYAIGDITAKLALAHVASAQGIIAAETIAGVETMPLNYIMMPRCTYCQPQVASFGYTEKQAREKGYEIKVAKFPWQANGKALGMGETAGFVKLISDAKYGEFLGGHLIGPSVTELLPELTLAQMWELTPAELARNVHAHPTLSEALMEVAHGLEGHMINL